MGREIKFRAWDKKNKELINLVGWRLYNLDQFQLFTLDGFQVLDINDVVFEQATGLHDKNGKEIYEGDIVRIDKEKYVCVYETHPWVGEFRFRALPHRKWCDGSNKLREIIGNIHDPELEKD